MSFSNKISRLPRAFSPDIAQEVASLAPYATGETRKLLEGAIGSSPYLHGLLAKEAKWLEASLDAPDAALKNLYAALPTEDAKALSDTLRQAKRRVALLTALADLGGVWPLLTVTQALSDFADLASDVAVKAMISQEIQRGKLPGATQDDVENAGGLVCLAMGKMGAGELNYSSDIDLICLFDETRYERDDYLTARSALVRATRKAMAMLSDLTGEGYVFRTDLRLRPDPAVTPVCLSMEAAERYYESLGRTWERAAYVKARPAAGDLAAGARFLETLTPFVWRKHLDFAAIQDAHDMRLRIREHKGFGRHWQPEGHNIKLGRGGIREIEFFTQTRQLIAGGRDPDLRLRGTLPALAALADKDWIPQDVASRLTDHYVAHRELEHRIQMVHDAQTHDVPRTEEGLARVACLMGVSVEDLKSSIKARVEEVHVLTEGFFAPDAVAPSAQEPQEVDPAIVARWRSYPAFRTERAAAIFERLKPELLNHLNRAAKPEEALVSLDGFLEGLPAGVQLFSLFESNPQLIDLLADIVGTAPALSRYLSRNSSVFDAVIGGAFFADWPGTVTLTKELSEQLAREEDYERKLDTARRWTKEWHFRIGVHHLRGLISAEQAGAQYAELANAVLRAIWPEVTAKFAEKHGDQPGRGAMILGMGSLGAGRLHATSDLDLIAIYDADGVEYSDGRKPLAARTYYARLTQALVTSLTAPMAEGRLYEVDMRLRPSGTQGPVATSVQSFKTYQQEQAWTWEHLALTRARPVAGNPDLQQEIEDFRIALLVRPSDAQAIKRDVQDMRARIAEAKTPEGQFDAKIGAGRLQDIELTAQTAALLTGCPDRSVSAALNAGVAFGWLDAAQSAALMHAYEVSWRVQTASKLLSEKPLDPDAIGAGGRSFLARETECDDISAVETLLTQSTRRAAEVIETLLGGQERKAKDGG
ncbi:glutamine-synthetase adenylyltransferase [Cognatishimia sp.]|uniref:[protein-PII] uridylyltransferase family protein n=1 Tax=Cognatishimia sp. TaxID=2211648 RepID=UPI0035154646|nr:glutamine-synthetase adenylyltransferase [Cognatishimia sp.]